MRRFNPLAWPSSPGWWCSFGWELATGDGAIPKQGEQGPEEVAERPSQVATEVIPHPVLYRMVYDLGRFDWAARWPMRHKTEALSEPFEIAQQLVVGPVSPRFASQRVHSV